MLNVKVCKRCYRDHECPTNKVFGSVVVPLAENPTKKRWKKKGVYIEVPRHTKSGKSIKYFNQSLEKWFKMGKNPHCFKVWRRVVDVNQSPPKRCPFYLEHIVSQDNVE